MIKKTKRIASKSTYDKFFESMTSKQRRNFEKGYKDLLLSEMLIAAMNQDSISVRELAKEAGVSPTIVQGMRSGTRKNVSAISLFRILKALGYKLVAERDGCSFPLDLCSSGKR